MNVLLNFGVTGVSILLHVTIEIRGDRRINSVTRGLIENKVSKQINF